MILLVSADRKGSGGIKKKLLTFKPWIVCQTRGVGLIFSALFLQLSSDKPQQHYSFIGASSPHFASWLFVQTPAGPRSQRCQTHSAFIPRVKSIQILDTKQTGSHALLRWMHAGQKMDGIFFFQCKKKQQQMWVHAGKNRNLLCGFIFSVRRLNFRRLGWSFWKLTWKRLSGLFLNANVRLVANTRCMRAPPDQLILSQTVSSQATNVRDTL